MHAVRGITTPPSATMSDGISTTTMTIIEILSQISDPVTEVQNYPPRPNSGTNRDSTEVECACHPATKITPSREQCGRTEAETKTNTAIEQRRKRRINTCWMQIGNSRSTQSCHVTQSARISSSHTIYHL